MKAKKELGMLIVDDNRFNREILKVLFAKEYETFFAEDGEEALIMLEKLKGLVDIVILDLVMPKMDGFETLKRRKTLDFFKDIPVVVITSSSDLEDQVKAFELGASDFVAKPFVPEIVTTRVNSVMISRKRYLSIEQEARNMKIKSETDQMTGLYNKATATRIVSDILAMKKGGLHAMLAIDIDNFKSVNDTEGHLMGDHTIKIVADLISGHFRKSDIVARIGGDEFLVFMADIPSMDVAREKANELVKNMRYKQNLTIPDNVTLSIGYVGIDEDEMGFDDVFKMADDALYYVKENGKSGAHEYGEAECEKETAEESCEKVILLVSGNKGVCNTVNSIIPSEVTVVQAMNSEEMKYILRDDVKRVTLIYADVSEEKDGGKHYWETFRSYEWTKDISVVAMCREGNMIQCKEAIENGVKDLVCVPLDAKSFKKRMKKHLMV